ncbi:MAG: glutamine--fructose-6-phosphate transaminase (isomerizing) [Candidatus Micrarchaeota archaeon]
MCGIIGYVGPGRASQIITDGLKRLEYRGYDSVGIAVVSGGKAEVRKDKGMVGDVSSALQFTAMEGCIGLGHTRWATHGAVCMTNAHPHADCAKNVILAHNGVIENYGKLKESLAARGHRFESGTDSEVIAHLVEETHRSEPLLKAFMRAIRQLEGSYAIVALSAGDKEERLFLARRNSPLVIGVGRGEMFCASDIPAMLRYTKTFVPLQEGDFAVLSRHGYKVYNADGTEAERKQVTVDWNEDIAQKGGFPHFMLKEISDQKHFVAESLAAEVSDAKKVIDAAEKIDIVAAGTSFHAGLMLAYLLQSEGKTAQAYIASDYAFIARPGRETLVIAISQSGETADVLQALRHAGEAKKVAITNIVGSTITSLADEVVYINAGPEVGVAATKTFTSQLAVIYRLFYPREKMQALPGLVGAALSLENEVKKIAARLAPCENVFFIGRGRNVPIALEASLKFKEITYVHSEAYPGGELKHGTLSLITDGVPVIALAPKDETITKMLGNMQEAKARGALMISVTDDPEARGMSDLYVPLPAIADPLLYPFALVIPLQLLAYHVSVLRGINPDRPRNLAKSVTVE